MYVYDIGYYSPEDSSYVQVIHDEMYSDEELRDIVEEAVLAVVAG